MLTVYCKDETQEQLNERHAWGKAWGGGGLLGAAIVLSGHTLLPAPSCVHRLGGSSKLVVQVFIEFSLQLPPFPDHAHTFLDVGGWG